MFVFYECQLQTTNLPYKIREDLKTKKSASWDGSVIRALPREFNYTGPGVAPTVACLMVQGSLFFWRAAKLKLVESYMFPCNTKSSHESFRFSLLARLVLHAAECTCFTTPFLRYHKKS